MYAVCMREMTHVWLIQDWQKLSEAKRMQPHVMSFLEAPQVISPQQQRHPLCFESVHLVTSCLCSHAYNLQVTMSAVSLYINHLV